MQFTGQVQNGVVVFDGPSPPEGAAVDVVIHRPATPSGLSDAVTNFISRCRASASENAGREKNLLELMGDVVGSVEGLPSDASKNVDHILYGHPKR